MKKKNRFVLFSHQKFVLLKMVFKNWGFARFVLGYHVSFSVGCNNAVFCDNADGLVVFHLLSNNFSVNSKTQNNSTKKTVIL